MIIFMDSKGTRPDSTRMGWVLSGPYNFDVGINFTYKTRNRFKSGTGNDMPHPEPDPVIHYTNIFYSFEPFPHFTDTSRIFEAILP